MSGWQQPTRVRSFTRFSEPAELDTAFRERLSRLRSIAGAEDEADNQPLFRYVPKHKVERIALTDGALKTFVTGMRQGVAAFGAPAFGFSNKLSQLLANLEQLMGTRSQRQDPDFC